VSPFWRWFWLGVLAFPATVFDAVERAHRVIVTLRPAETPWEFYAGMFVFAVVFAAFMGKIDQAGRR
jgi:hypothetical protein